MKDSVTIPKRFCGPPLSANGGYVAGLAAEFLAGFEDQPLQARIRAPAPLDVPLSVRRDRESAALVHGETTVVEVSVTSAHLTRDLAPPPDLETAKRWSQNYPGFEGHFFPTCFVCGPQRTSGDGLRIFCGPGEDTHHLAGYWLPDASLAENNGNVASRFVWAALDCPGGAAALSGQPLKPIVLAKLAALIQKPVIVEREYIVHAWRKKVSGMRYLVGSAVCDIHGNLCAVAEGLWLEAPNFVTAN